jgi:site-specific recombinase XerD
VCNLFRIIVKRTTQVLSIEEVVHGFLVTKEKTSHYHVKDLARRLKRWTDDVDPLGLVHGINKQQIELYLGRYSGQNFINHRAALSHLFGYAFKIGATPENPLLGVEKPRIKRGRPVILSEREFATLLGHACNQSRLDVLNWLVLGDLWACGHTRSCSLNGQGFTLRLAKFVLSQVG